MVKPASFVLCMVACACTNYVDAILPPPDAAAPVDVVQEQPLVGMDEKFGQAGFVFAATSPNDEVADACVGPGGVTYVLLKERCTVVAVTSQGGLDLKFGKGGWVAGDVDCDARSLTCDSQENRLLIVSQLNPNSLLIARNLDASPSMTLQDGYMVKLEFSSIGSLLPTATGLLMAGTAPSTTGITMEARDSKGQLVNRQTIDTGEVSKSALLYETSNQQLFLLADVPSTERSLTFDLLIAAITPFANLGPYTVTNTLGTTGSALQVLIKAHPGAGGQPLVLGQGWAKANEMFSQPFVWAPNNMGFGESGASTLPQAEFTSYADLAYRAGSITVVGTVGAKNDRRPIVTVLDEQGKLDPRFLMPGFFTLPLKEPASAAKVLFVGDNTIVVVGTVGTEGKARLFLSRVILN